MALTLDAALAAAQNSQTRRPRVDIVAGSYAESLPLQGSFLTGGTGESAPSSITHSSGRLILAAIAGTAVPYHIRVGYTDTARTSFTFVDFDAPASHTLLDVSTCELATGNVGILYRSQYGTSQYLKWRIVTPTGVAVSSGDIATYSASPYLSGPTVIRLASGSYLAVYTRLVSTDYTFYAMTSADFQTWGSPSEITIGGALVASQRKFDPHLVQETTGAIWLSFAYTESISASGVELSNIYYSVSSNDGATWANAVKNTNYSGYGTVAAHPVFIQKTAGTMRMIFTEIAGALTLDETSAGFCGTDCAPTDLCFDATTRKLYITSTRASYGAKNFWCVVELDVDTWTITGCWDTTTTPAFNALFSAQSIWWERHHGERYLIPVGVYGNNYYRHISLLNADADTITEYNFDNWPTYGLTQNVTHSVPSMYLEHTWVDFDSSRLYAVFSSGRRRVIGYIDVTDVGPTYTFNIIVDDPFCNPVAISSGGTPESLLILPSEDLIIYAVQNLVSTWKGCVCVYHLSTGALYKKYTIDTHAGFPYRGIGVGRIAYYDGHIYGTFEYKADDGEADKRGLADIDLATDTIVCHRPSWATLDEYSLRSCLSMGDGRILVSSDGYGVSIFDPSGGAWTQYDSDTLPGIYKGWLKEDEFMPLAYDPTTGMIFAGASSPLNSWTGLSAFLEAGLIRQSHYSEGVLGAGWTFASPVALVTGFLDYDTAAALDPDDAAMYAFWVNQTGTALALKWDKEGAALNLANYLLRGDDIVLKRSSVDGKPAQLEFRVSHGHLFDPHNSTSLLSIYLRKGRKLTLKFGEEIAGVDTWQNQGSFLITETSMSYKRGIYPVMSVQAQDRRCTWEQHQILATDYYDVLPESILSDIVTEHLGIVLADVDLPVFDNRELIYAQWVEAMAAEIVAQVCRRFSYFPRMTVDDKFSARKISDGNAVDHVYSDLTKIIDFTPDDSFSDFTNRVIVTGAERSEIEVLYNEERIDSVNGTIGWWGCKNTYTIYYSQDHSRRCRDPRLVILQSSSSIGFQLAGQIHESISYVDPLETYCTITVTAPNLIPILIFAIPEWAAAHFVPDAVSSLGAGWTYPVGRIIESVWMFVIMMVISAIGNFQYEIWARPLGKVRRSIQGQADDEELQTLIQNVVTRKLEEPLCTSVAACNFVAEAEMTVATCQRKRVRFSKVAHLQDEEGDTIQIPHPYNGTALRIFITDLTRKFRVPESSGADGYFIDEIEGWRL